MFQPLSPGDATTIWDALRSAILPIIQNHQDRADFGLGVLAGNPNTFVCPVFNTVPMGLNNYQNIVSQYPTAGLRDDKLEAPIAQILPMLPPMFTQAPGTGKSYVLFLTAGEPDFCDDQSTICSVDAAIAAISDLRTLSSIKTYVFGQQSRTNAHACPGGLQAYANAGAARGRTATAPVRVGAGWAESATTTRIAPWTFLACRARAHCHRSPTA